MSKQEGESLLRTLVSVFRDANVRMSYRGFPFVRDEMAQSHLFRIMDFWITEIWDNTSTNAISKEVILTLLQCAARLYEGKTHAKAAVDLIESKHTRAILSLGIQDALCRVVHQRCVESMRSENLEERNAENYSQRADLFSTIQKSKARQLDHQGMIFEHISSLCCSHGAALQNSFDIPRIDEQFMFHNYVTLSKAFSRYEKSWLVILLPDIFKWEDRDSCDGTSGDRLLAPNFDAKEGGQDAPSNASKEIWPSQAAITPNVSRSAKMSRWSLPWGPGEPSPLTTDEAVQLSLGHLSNREWNELRGVSGESGIGGSDPAFKSFTLTDDVIEFEKWMDLLQKNAINYPRPASVRAVSSALKAPHEFYDQKTSQRVERRPIDIKIERKDAGDYHHKEWKDGLLSPSGDASDGDCSLLGSGEDSESIFRFSPDAHNDSTNGNLLSTLLEDADNEHQYRISSAKEAQPTFPSVTPPFHKSINKDSPRRSNLLQPGEWMRGHQTKTRLSTIPEESQGLEVDDGIIEREARSDETHCI